MAVWHSSFLMKIYPLFFKLFIQINMDLSKFLKMNNMKSIALYKISLLLLISFDIYSQTYNYSDRIEGLPNVSRTVNKFSTTFNGETIRGEYLTILGINHSDITNPFIIVEGIDFLDDQDFSTHIFLYNDGNNSSSNLNNALINNLYLGGYDIIILDFDNATDYIQNNAMLLVELINNLYSSPTLTGNDLVVLGYSMGGLVARYALAWMEANEQNHHTRLFISHDSPHKGANFPLGLQELVEDIRNNTSIAWIAVDILMKTFEYNIPAARQMLAYHYLNSADGEALPADDKISFFEELYNLNPAGNGYPSRPTKIAISNGNFSGNLQENSITGSNLEVGDEILFFDYWKNNGNREVCHCTLIDFIFGQCKYKCEMEYFASDHITATVRVGFPELLPTEEFFVYSKGKYEIGNTGIKIFMGGTGEQFFDKKNHSLDVAPGSFSSSYMELLGKSIAEKLTNNVTFIANTCFIPTTSALDLNIYYASPFNLNDAKCFTNFDFIHANEEDNIDHFNITDEATDFILQHTFNPVPPEEILVYDANELTIPSNTFIKASDSYNKTIATSITNAGIFQVEKDGKSVLIAGENITLSPGFSIDFGGTFIAKINDGLYCQFENEYMPHYFGTKLKISNGIAPYYNEYNCDNIEEMQDYSLDSLYLDCFKPVDENEFTQAQIDSVLIENISIVPNPNDGVFEIQMSDKIIIDNLQIEIFDVLNNSIFLLDHVTSNTISINLQSSQTGVMKVFFKFSDGDIIHTQNIIKY
jgi:hypothetical protein